MLALANLAVSPAWASAQQAPAFVHEVWTVQDGLPVNSINALLQSRDGYLWAATFDGLVRFDGVRFTVYHTGNTEELPSNRIVGLTEGSDGSL
jgi:ligand-binding sensor domain-containing protein